MDQRHLFRCVLAAGLAVGGCQVRLVEQHDPRISQGLSEYQQALETFSLTVAHDYAGCEFARQHMATVAKANCASEPASTRAACQARLESEAGGAKTQADEGCKAASYEANAQTFYFPNEAGLRVLLVRARVLDSGGACVWAIDGVKKLTGFVTDERIQEWISSPAATNQRNCTEVQMQTILRNHKELEASHQRLDELSAQGALSAIDYKTVFGENSLSGDTLEQNIKIALFLEEAKKRGSQ